MPQDDNIPKPERLPFFQRLLDNPFLLLFFGRRHAHGFLYSVGRDGNRHVASRSIIIYI